MFYDSVTQEQVIATRSLLKFLRYLRVCGLLELEVYPSLKTSKKWAYCIKAGVYYPHVHQLPIEMIENEFSID